MSEEKKEKTVYTSPNVAPGLSESKLTDEAITKLKVDYVHTLLKIIERQDFQVYAVKLGRLNDMDRVLKENGLRTVITVSTEPFAEHRFEEKELRHLTEKDL